MLSNKITRWVPLFTMLICGLLIATAVVAQPMGWGGEQGQNQGPHQGQGPGQFDKGGMHGGGGAMMLFHPGGPFANEEVQELMKQVKVLCFFNKLELTADQLEAIADLSDEARDATSDMAERATDMAIDKLTERRDSLLRGEKPDEFERPDKRGIPDDMKEQAGDVKDALKGIMEDFFNILTEEQIQALKQHGGQQFGHRPGMGGPRGGHGDGQGSWQGGGPQGPRQPRAEMPDDNTPGELQDRKFDNKDQRPDQQGFHGGPGGQGGGPGMMGGGPQMMHMKVLEILLDPDTVEIIEMKLRYM